MGIPVVTYEFGEQRGRIWLAQNGEVMRQETDELWAASQGLAADRRPVGADPRRCSPRARTAACGRTSPAAGRALPSQGGEQVRQALGLDARPVVLLAANVIGDSLTLGRQVFTRRHDRVAGAQRAVLRRTAGRAAGGAHPSRRALHSRARRWPRWCSEALPQVPEHIHLVEAADPINTYDLVEIADLGLVYTTTVGMEMAMSGVPVDRRRPDPLPRQGLYPAIRPPGRSIYRMVDQALAQPQEHRLSREQVELAWNYAYRFFFEYPTPFPWHLLSFWDELESWPAGACAVRRRAG